MYLPVCSRKLTQHQFCCIICVYWTVAEGLLWVQTSAACCGLYGYRPTRGTISMQGVLPIAGELDSVAWLVHNPALLPRLGQAFSLPGGLLHCVAAVLCQHISCRHGCANVQHPLYRCSLPCAPVDTLFAALCTHVPHVACLYWSSLAVMAAPKHTSSCCW